MEVCSENWDFDLGGAGDYKDVRTLMASDPVRK